MTRTLVVMAALLALCGCGGSSDPVAKPPTTGHLAAHAKSVVTRTVGTTKIRDVCDPHQVTWECYWRSFEDDGAGMLEVDLRLPASMSDSAKDRLVAESGFSFFAVYGELLPDLESVEFLDLRTHLQIGLPVRRSDTSVPVP